MNLMTYNSWNVSNPYMFRNGRWHPQETFQIKWIQAKHVNVCIASPALELLKYNLVTSSPTSLLIYSMQQSASWEANRFAASQEIPLVLWNRKLHYRIHK
jgi:hypothetical protein